MYKKFSILFLLLFTFILILPNQEVNAQAEEDQGQITEGTDYWFGLPECGRDRAEAVRWGTYPVELWLSSKVYTHATIESPGGKITTQTVELLPNQVRIVSLPDEIECSGRNGDNEVVTEKGIHVFSDDPISVGVFVAYKWSGEAYRVTPTAWLGKEYYTLNMYQDRVKMYSGVTENKPPEILVIATEDGTEFQYYPTWETAGGIKPGKNSKVRLNKGQTFLIQGKCYDDRYQQWPTDLTGTKIVANKPVAVISGHTKAAFPRFSVSMLGIKSDFMRNMLMEMMWPVELLGKEYVSAPIKYLNRPYTAANIIPDIKGDIIRFVATEDGTQITRMRQDGTGFYQFSPTMKAGDYYDIVSQEEATMYKSNKPVLVGQYGKAWWLSAVSPIVSPPDGKSGDNPLNPPRNGQGMMLTLAPIEHWCTYATFKSPAGMDDFVYITFETDKLKNLRFDGTSFTALWGSAVREILGTPYSYVCEVVSSGDHYVEGLNGARFAGYAYGNWDAGKDGFAYGYPIGLNYASPCEDSLFITDNIICGNVVGNGFAVPPDSSCARIFNVMFNEKKSYNYSFKYDPFDTRTATHVRYTLTVVNPYDSAYAIVTVMTRSGKSETKIYKYVPEAVNAIPTILDFGLMKPGDNKCLTFKLKNPSTVPVTVKELKLRGNKPEFVLDTKDIPATILPGEELTIEVCATALTNTPAYQSDSVYAVLACYERTLLKLEMRTGTPVVWIGDAKFGQVPKDKPFKKDVEIINRGQVPVELYDITWADHTHFLQVENLDFPIILNNYGDIHIFTVTYQADQAGVQDSTRAFFTGNTTEIKLYSDWTGMGLEAGPTIEGYDWKRQRVIDQFAGVTKYDGKVVVDNLGNSQIEVVDVKIDDDLGGVFKLDKSKLPGLMQPNSPVELPVTFAPNAEIEYTANVTFTALVFNEEKSVTATLHGIGTQPHIQLAGKDFGPPILVGESVQGDGGVDQLNIVSDLTSMNLTIKELKITGPDANAFRIMPAFFEDHPYPITMKPKEVLTVPLEFTAMHPGDHTAYLSSDDDAPLEDPQPLLIGRGQIIGLETSNKYFGLHFTTLSNKDNVYITNTGTVDITFNDIQVRRDPAWGTNDLNNWQILGYRSAIKGTIADIKSFTLQGNDTLYVDAIFTPDQARSYSARIEYDIVMDNTTQTAISKVTGDGKVIKTKIRIPKGYVTDVGALTTIDVIIDQPSDEPKAIDEADIHEFKVLIYYKQQGEEVIDVCPRVDSPADIITTGTMLDGWTCDETQVKDGLFWAHFVSPQQPLRGSGSLFKFKMLSLLSDLNTVPLPVSMELSESRPYVTIEEEPGDISVTQVCIDSLRLPKLTNFEYMLSSASPNPVEDKTSIMYRVGLEAPTIITLYNSTGSKIATLVNEVKIPGNYTYDLNVKDMNLSSGVYFYRIESGPYSEVKELVIRK
ncbi:MAG: type sorting protein [Bacteroidota bacterium]|nr:type sorting protein [Bacteroidota bacterium]